jgi:hypothetical protein
MPQFSSRITATSHGEYNRGMNAPAASSSGSTARQGKLLVLAMLGLAALASGFAWYWNVNRGHRTLAFYGPEAAALIRSARTVEVFVPPSANESNAPSGQEPEAARTRRVEISRAPGLLNARSSLLDDASYEWDHSPVADSPTGRVVIRFMEKNHEVLLRFDFDARSVSILPEGRKATLVEKTAEGWRAFIARHARVD